MIPDHANDPVLRSLQKLPAVAPGERRATQVRARCHARLARQARRRVNRDRPSVPLIVIQSLLGGLCAVYFAAIVHDALRLRGFF